MRRRKARSPSRKAGYDLAVLAANRWKALRASRAVSQQTADEKAGDAQARKAQVAAAHAHVDRIKALEDCKDIVAPFDIAAIDTMRASVRARQISAADTRKGLKVTLTLPQYPGRQFIGANAIETGDEVNIETIDGKTTDDHRRSAKVKAPE